MSDSEKQSGTSTSVHPFVMARWGPDIVLPRADGGGVCFVTEVIDGVSVLRKVVEDSSNEYQNKVSHQIQNQSCSQEDVLEIQSCSQEDSADQSLSQVSNNQVALELDYPEPIAKLNRGNEVPKGFFRRVICQFVPGIKSESVLSFLQESLRSFYRRISGGIYYIVFGPTDQFHRKYLCKHGIQNGDSESCSESPIKENLEIDSQQEERDYPKSSSLGIVAGPKATYGNHIPGSMSDRSL